MPETLDPFERMRVLLLGVHIPKPVNDRQRGQLMYSTERIQTTDNLVLEGWFAPGEEGRGVVILFHGYAGSKSSLLEDAMAFRALGLACLLVDFRGSGGSQGYTTTVGWRESDDVLAAVRVVRERLAPGAPIILFGQSMGGAAVLRALPRLDRRPRRDRGERLRSNAERDPESLRHHGAAVVPAAELLCFWGGVQNGFDAFAHNPSMPHAAFRRPC
jgi:pimeloyl-ACP methyl ester carboxylesterase